MSLACLWMASSCTATGAAVLTGIRSRRPIRTASKSINAQITRPSTGTPSGAPLINDPANRVYGGLDPSTQPRERTEVVNSHAEGKYLVICGVQPHFVNDNMYGWVRVLPADIED